MDEQAAPPVSLGVRTFSLGPFQTNCYVIWPADSERSAGAPQPGQACWVIDVGFEPEPLLNFIQEHRLKTEAVMLTHAHADHIGGLEELRRRLDRPSVWIHPAEAEHLGDPWRNLSAFMGSEVTAQPAEASLGDGQSLSLGPLSFEIRHTPGHSPGGISLYQAESRLALVGDTLFAGGIGRSDFPESDPATLQASIRQRLLSLPDEVTVYPGHGPPTTIGRERQSNPFLQAES